MRLLQTLETRLRLNERLTESPERIASSKFEQVWERVRGHVFDLGSNEARGYVRARAGMIVDRALHDAAPKLSSAAVAKLRVLTLDTVIRRVTAHVHETRQPHLERRAA